MQRESSQALGLYESLLVHGTAAKKFDTITTNFLLNMYHNLETDNIIYCTDCTITKDGTVTYN